MSVTTIDVVSLSRAITRRRVSVFGPAIEGLSEELGQRFSGASILVSGGAGFIAGQTIMKLLSYGPSKIAVLDSNENALAELVRDLRGEGAIPETCAFEPRLVDVTQPILNRVVDEAGPFDVALAFAAAKHVRSERDVASALHMLNVNINGTMRVVEQALVGNPECSPFVVSTDKAASPSSMMGASKRAMEMAVIGTYPQTTTTRFANVAFSSGSLLESWLIRLSRGQALAVPAETERFFVSPSEAGELCTCASIASPGTIVVPSAGAVDSLDLVVALERVLESLNIVPAFFESETDANAFMGPPNQRAVLVTARDTAGEKPAEVFVGGTERQAAWVRNLDVVTSTFSPTSALELAAFVREAIADRTRPNLEEVSKMLSATVTEFKHVTSAQRLDDRI